MWRIDLQDLWERKKSRRTPRLHPEILGLLTVTVMGWGALKGEQGGGRGRGLYEACLQGLLASVLICKWGDKNY